MSTEEYNEILANAKTAFENMQYQASLDCYKKAIELKPDDVPVLSKAGNVCILLSLYDEAFDYFIKAVDSEPENGDNYYNLGNVYYLVKNYPKCLEMYTEAENVGCSPNVQKNLCFQKAVLCEARGDAESALSYLKKYEEAYEDDIKSIDPRVLLEKAKLQMMIKDYDEAEVSAAMLLNVQPQKLHNYLLYFSILFALKKYDKAENVLLVARDTAKMTDEEKYALSVQQAGFYTELIDVFADNEEVKTKCIEFAEGIYKDLLDTDNPTVSKSDVQANVANLYIKAGQFDDAIDILEKLLPASEITHSDDDIHPISPVKSRDDITEEDIIEEGITEEDIAEELNIADEGNVTDNNAVETSIGMSEEDVSDGLLEQIRYMLMSCYVSKEEYSNALGMADYLRDSDNFIYRYFSRYCTAYSKRKLNPDDGTKVYEETIAFYRSRMIENPKDKYAVILRARMYAELGKYAKSEEMAKLLGDEEHEALNKYIEQCKSENSNQ